MSPSQRWVGLAMGLAAPSEEVGFDGAKPTCHKAGPIPRYAAVKQSPTGNGNAPAKNGYTMFAHRGP